MDSVDRFDAAYARLNSELNEKKSLRSQIDAEIGEITQRLQKLDDARVVLAELGGSLTPIASSIESPADGKNKVRDLVLAFMETSPPNQWLAANAILDALVKRGYEAPASRGSAYASVYVTLGRLADDGLIAVADGNRGKVFAKRGSSEGVLTPVYTRAFEALAATEQLESEGGK